MTGSRGPIRNPHLRVLERRKLIHAELRTKYPTLMARPPAAVDCRAVLLGSAYTGAPVFLPERPRLEHALVIGTTGGGKSKHLQSCICQDIADGCGVLVIDPHGEHPDSLYRSVLCWMQARGYLERRVVHLIDPSALSHTVGFNPLSRPDPNTELSVIAGVTLEAFSRAWGGEDMARKPTIERLLSATFSALAELNLSLVEAPMLLDRHDRHGLRRHAIETVQDRYTRTELTRLDELAHDERRRADFDLEVLGPINRLARFLRPAAVASMVGQTAAGLDFVDAFDNGHVILCNLSGSARIYESDADLLGRLITRFAFFHAKRRRNPRRPFFIYMDECHRYLSGDLENILAESRKYGLGAVLATQWLQQLRKESENMLAAVLNATNVKTVFRIKDPKEAEQLAEMVIPFDLEMPVQALTKPAVIGYRRTELANNSTAENHSTTRSRSTTSGRSETYTETEGGSRSITLSEGTSVADNESETESEGRSRAANAISDRSISEGVSTSRGRSTSSSSSRAETESENWSTSRAISHQRSRTEGLAETRGETHSHGTSEALEPILRDLPSAVHSRDNMRYMAARLVRSLPTGRAFVSYVSAAGLVTALVKVPNLAEIQLPLDGFSRLREQVLSHSLSAIPARQAAELIAQRERMFGVQAETAEPGSFRTNQPPQVPKPGRSRPDAARRRRSRPNANGKSAE
jgi:hypothetical protein